MLPAGGRKGYGIMTERKPDTVSGSFSAKETAYLGMMLAFALILGYAESLLPFSFGIPGIKLGLPNLAVVLLLYRSGVRRAFWIDLLRILLNGFLFGNLYGILYSLAGGLLSFLVMVAAKETGRFRFGLSVTGVSIAGGVFHNAGQIAVAAFVVETAGLYYYLPPLLAAGAGTGFLIGLVSERILITTGKKRDGL